MADVFCYECSARENAWVSHPWPPCDLNPDGTAIDPQPCGHRRVWREPDGSCAECKHLRPLDEEPVTDPDDNPLSRCRMLLSGIASHARMLDEALAADRVPLLAYVEANLEGIAESMRCLLEKAEGRGR